MPKLKTRKSLAKRMKITKKKKMLRFKAGRRHLLSGKKRARKRNLRHNASMLKGERQMIRRAMPYAF